MEGYKHSTIIHTEFTHCYPTRCSMANRLEEIIPCSFSRDVVVVRVREHHRAIWPASMIWNESGVQLATHKEEHELRPISAVLQVRCGAVSSEKTQAHELHSSEQEAQREPGELPRCILGCGQDHQIVDVG